MQLGSLLLPLAFVGCASDPRTAVHTLVDRPVHVSAIRGYTLQIWNRGPGQLAYEYRSETGTLVQGEIGVDVFFELDPRRVHDLWLYALLRETCEVSLYVDAGEGEVLRLTREARREQR